MTPEAHNRYVGLAHLGYGISNIVMIGIGGVYLLGRGFWSREDMIMMSVGFAVIGFANLILTVPSFVTAWALLKRKSWAKVTAIVAAAVQTMFFPLGPLCAGYTLWFLFSSPGKALYDKPHQTLPAAVTSLTVQSETERARAGMPDWR